MTAHSIVQKSGRFVLIAMDEGFVVASLKELHFDKFVVKAVLSFFRGHKDLVKSKSRCAVVVHAGTDHRNGSRLGQSHKLFLQVGDLTFNPSNFSLRFFDCIKRPFKPRLPAGKRETLMLQTLSQSLNLSLNLSVGTRLWQRAD